MLGRTLTQDNGRKAVRFLKAMLGPKYTVKATADGILIQWQFGWVDESDRLRMLMNYVFKWGTTLRDVRTKDYPAL